MKKFSLFTVLLILSIVVVSQNNKETIFSDDFETYNAGEQLVCQNPDDWTTFSNAPCSGEDPYITNEQAYSGSNSVLIEGSNSLVLDLPNYTSGVYVISFQMFIPEGYEGYLITFQNYESGDNLYGMSVHYYDTYGGSIYAGSYTSFYFYYAHDTWLLNKVYIDLNNDQATFYINGIPIRSWVWSTGLYGENDLNQLGGSSFSNYYTNPTNSKFFLDDYNILYAPSLNPPTNLTGYVLNNQVVLNWDIPESNDKLDVDKDEISYNIYSNDELIATTNDTSYAELNLDLGIYEYYVKAVYTEGESMCSNNITIFLGDQLFPPTNLIGPDVVGIGYETNLSWDKPEGSWIHWDDGQNDDDGLGLNNGGTFFVASRWTYGNTLPYSGLSLSKISFFPYNDPSAEYTLKVWTGENASTEIISQEVTSFDINTWNEVTLDNPVVLGEATEYWFGYAVTHTEGNKPAGIDAGPAIQGSGDMVSFDGNEWISLSAEYDLNYNWNIQAFVSLNEKENPVIVSNFSNPNLKPKTDNTYFQNTNKGFLFYNVYRDGELLANTTDTTYSYIPAELGIYTYCVTAVYDEGESECSNEWVVDILSEIKEDPSNKTEVYPNPTTNLVNIKSDLKINNIKIYNYAGQLIWDKKTDADFYEINTSQFEAGLYFFRIETGKGVVSRRVVVQ